MDNLETFLHWNLDYEVPLLVYKGIVVGRENEKGLVDEVDENLFIQEYVKKYEIKEK